MSTLMKKKVMKDIRATFNEKLVDAFLKNNITKRELDNVLPSNRDSFKNFFGSLLIKFI